MTEPVAKERGKKAGRWLHRLLRLASRLLAGLLILVGLALLVVHSGWAKEKLRARAEAKFAEVVTGSVSIGSLDYGFLFSDLQLRDIEIRDQGGVPVVQVASLHLDVARWASLRGRLTVDRLQLKKMQLSVHVDEKGHSNLWQLFRKRKDTSSALIVRAIEIDSLGFVLSNQGGKTLELTDLRLRANVQRDQVTDLVLDELETDVFVQIGKRQSISGHLSQRGARLRLEGEELQLQLEPLRTKLEFRRDGFSIVKTEILLEKSRLSLAPGRLVAELADAVIGPLQVGSASLALATRHGLLHGPQRVSLREIYVDSLKLGALLGRDLQVGMATGTLEIAGPADAMVIAGEFETPEGHIDIAGTVDATGPNAPVYSLKTTTNIRLDMIGALPHLAVVLRSLLPTLFRIDLHGKGHPQLDGRVDLHVEALSELTDEPVKLLDLKAHLAKQSLKLDSFTLTVLGTELEAGGLLDTEDFGIGATLTIRGNARQSLAHLKELGLQVPKGLRLPSSLNLRLALRGNFNDRIVVTLAPSETAIAGGKVLVVGQAEFASEPEGMELVSAGGTMTLRRLRLDGIARLARRRAPFTGIVSGRVELAVDREKRRLDHRLRIDMPAARLSLQIEGAMVGQRWQGRVSATDLEGGPELAWVEGSLPLNEEFRLSRNRPMDLRAKMPRALLAEHSHRLPVALQRSLANHVQGVEGELNVALRGSLRRPAGQIELTTRGTSTRWPGRLLEIAINTEIGSDRDGTVHLRPDGQMRMVGEARSLLALGGEVHVDASRKLSLGERVKVQLQLDVPEHSLAELAPWFGVPDSRWRTEPGAFDAQLKIENTLASPRLTLLATLAGIQNIAGSTSQVVATGSVDREGGSLELRLGADKPLRVALQAKRQGTGVEIHAQTEAASIRLAELLPSALADLVPKLVPLKLADDARLVSDLAIGARLELVEGRVHPLALNLTGSAEVQLKRLPLPLTSRSYRNVKLALLGKGDALAAELTLGERDTQESDRRLAIAANIALRSTTGWGLSKVDATVQAKQWLLFGGTLGNIDAPRGTLNADLSVSASLSGPLPIIDITANALAYSEPDRSAFGHGVEYVAPFGDVVFADTSRIPLGKLGPPKSAEKPRRKPPVRALLRVHVPTPIHVAKGPLTLAVKGDVEMPIGFGEGPSGHVEVVDGSMLLFSQQFAYEEADIRLGSPPVARIFFTRTLPPDVTRKLSRYSSGREVILLLRPIGGGPVIEFLGAGNKDLIEAMSLLHTGQPLFRSEPDAAASSTVRAPQMSQPLTIAFVKANIPRLDLFDRFAAWSNAYDSNASYGQVRYLDAEKRLGDGATRLRWIARPEQIGRSIAEAQLDRLFLDTPSLSLGVGARAGSRLGGGIGLFFEWSSED